MIPTIEQLNAIFQPKPSSVPLPYNPDEMAGYLTYWLLKGAPQAPSKVDLKTWNQRLTQWLDTHGPSLHVEEWLTDDFDRLATHMSVLRPVNFANEMAAARGDVLGHDDPDYHGQFAVFADKMRARSISWADRVEADDAIQQYVRDYARQLGGWTESSTPAQHPDGGARQLASSQLIRSVQNPQMVI